MARLLKVLFHAILAVNMKSWLFDKCPSNKVQFILSLTAASTQLLDPALSHYRDRRFPGNQQEFEQRLQESTTLYIGNLSFYTTEEQIYEVHLCQYSAH